MCDVSPMFKRHSRGYYSALGQIRGESFHFWSYVGCLNPEPPLSSCQLGNLFSWQEAGMAGVIGRDDMRAKQGGL